MANVEAKAFPVHIAAAVSPKPFVTERPYPSAPIQQPKGRIRLKTILLTVNLYRACSRHAINLMVVIKTGAMLVKRRGDDERRFVGLGQGDVDLHPRQVPAAAGPANQSSSAFVHLELHEYIFPAVGQIPFFGG
ncbi:hypothetical protein D3C73_1342310 [compost metagenome]